MLFLRSLVFYLGWWLSVLIYAPLVLLTFPIPPLPRYRLIRLWGRFNVWWLRLTCGISYEVEGIENLPARPSVIMAKHQSTWETLAFEFLFPPHVWVLKRELLWVPLFGWAMAMSLPIAIDRRSGKKAVQQVIEQGTQRLRDGFWVMVFPEGTRVAPGEQRRFGIGGAALAQASGAPVVPVAHNAGSVWPRRQFLKRPGRVRIVIGRPIESAGRSAEDIRREAERWVHDTTASLEAGTGIAVRT